jgi:CheY-like chemotaxis protein
VNQGTTVRIYLPRAQAIPTLAAKNGGSNLQQGKEFILLVEDDPLVQDYSEQLLLSLGYKVVVASNGEEALALLDKHPDLDLLFTDIVMPGSMNGRQLADEARRRRPDLKVLFTSGYTENAIVHQGRLDPGVNLISKPYLRKQLADKLRALFSAPEEL